MSSQLGVLDAMNGLLLQEKKSLSHDLLVVDSGKPMASTAAVVVVVGESFFVEYFFVEFFKMPVNATFGGRLILRSFDLLLLNFFVFFMSVVSSSSTDFLSSRK
jgi:hypothetical protein